MNLRTIDTASGSQRRKTAAQKGATVTPLKKVKRYVLRLTSGPNPNGEEEEQRGQCTDVTTTRQENSGDFHCRAIKRTARVDVGGMRIAVLSPPGSLDPVVQVAAAKLIHIVFGHHPEYALGGFPADLMTAARCSES